MVYSFLPRRLRICPPLPPTAAAVVVAAATAVPATTAAARPGVPVVPDTGTCSPCDGGGGLTVLIKFIIISGIKM